MKEQNPLTTAGLEIRGDGAWACPIGKSLCGVKLSQVDLQNADLQSADLTGADLTGANLTGADLTNAVLIGAEIVDANLTSVNLTGAILTGAILDRANLTGACLDGTRLPRALSEAVFTGTSLRHAKLRGVDLRGASLQSADLTGADLTGANLTEANLTGANLTDATLSGANLTNAILPEQHSASAVRLGASPTNDIWITTGASNSTTGGNRAKRETGETEALWSDTVRVAETKSRRQQQRSPVEDMDDWICDDCGRSVLESGPDDHRACVFGPFERVARGDLDVAGLTSHGGASRRSRSSRLTMREARRAVTARAALRNRCDAEGPATLESELRRIAQPFGFLRISDAIDELTAAELATSLPELRIALEVDPDALPLTNGWWWFPMTNPDGSGTPVVTTVALKLAFVAGRRFAGMDLRRAFLKYSASGNSVSGNTSFVPPPDVLLRWANAIDELRVVDGLIEACAPTGEMLTETEWEVFDALVAARGGVCTTSALADQVENLGLAPSGVELLLESIIIVDEVARGIWGLRGAGRDQQSIDALQSGLGSRG